MRLNIVIPALNEEAAIGSIIERTLAAREAIVRGSPVDEVEVIVVSDGSTDRTADIAASYRDVRVIVFEHNRGYGAAIKRGFEESSGELVGFLDADGTCDPQFFASLCEALSEEDAVVAIGSRMGPLSRMPAIRRFGNRVYALILSVMSNKVVTDAASGMRVIRRSVLPQLYPLPDGLHFTPAMSARVLMDERLKIVERPMTYEERVGESKLHVIGDGLRFFHTIFEMSMMWRPAKLFAAAATVCLAVMAFLAAHPMETWLRLGTLQGDMIYRLLFCTLLGAIGVTLLSASVVSDQLRRLCDQEPAPPTFASTLLDKMHSTTGLAVAVALSIPLLAWLVGPGIWTRLADGYVDLHWSRVVLAGLIVFGVTQMLVTVLITNLVRFHISRRKPPPKRTTRPISAPVRAVSISALEAHVTKIEDDVPVAFR